MGGVFTSKKSHVADPIVVAFEYPHNRPSNIRIFDAGGSGLKTMRFALVQEPPRLKPTCHADFLDWLQPELPSEGHLKIGMFDESLGVSPVEWIRRYVDAEAEQAGVATDSGKTAYTVSNGFLQRVGLKSHWTKNFRQDEPYPLGIPIVDPFNNLEGTGGIDDTLAHFYDAQLRTTSADYPLLNVACGTFAVFLYADSERAMPTRSPHMVRAGDRVSRQVLKLESGTLDPEETSKLKQEIENMGEAIAQNILSKLADTLKDIAESAAWSTNVYVDETCRLNYPEIATNSDKQFKDPQVDNLFKTVVFSGGVAQKLDLAGRAEKWWRMQQDKLKLPCGYRLTFKLGDRRAPYTGAAAYVLDRIIHPQSEHRVFAPKFPNGLY